MPTTYLGLDSSTQSLTAVLIDPAARKILHQASINYDADLPEYGTTNGVLPADDPTLVHAPPLMWVEALDRLLIALRKDGFPVEDIAAISGSGQQHGSVYWNRAWPSALASLDPAHPPAGQLQGALARPTAPIWMDSSTTAECEEICEALGGAESTARLTGSSTFERFTGPQIRKFFKEEPDAYANTGPIALVSSMMCSLLAGKVAPIDHGDGAGMNLMRIEQKAWYPPALEATAPGLAQRLPGLVEPWSVIGPISDYFVQRYGFAPGTEVIAWSGDNPNSVIGLGLTRPGMVAISLGTSDTFFGTLEDCRTDPRGEGHLFGSPTGGYMSLICLKNGSLARERVRDMYGLDWAGFSAALSLAPPGNNGKMMLPWFEPEIVPRVLNPGVRRRGLAEDDVPGNCRAVVESQMLSMQIHSAWMDVETECIYATGGASANREILQVMADVHGCPVYRSEIGDSAALGAALRAAHGHLQARNPSITWDEMVKGFSGPVAGFEIHPTPETAPVYAKAVKEYQAFEKWEQP
jgi:xylulokinase